MENGGLFNTSHFAALLLNRFTGGGMEAVTATGTMARNPVTHLTPAKFLSRSKLRIGLAVAAAFLGGIAAAPLPWPDLIPRRGHFISGKPSSAAQDPQRRMPRGLLPRVGGQ